MKIVVTGGMGYIGSHVVQALKHAGAQVISVDHAHRPENELEGVEYLYGDYADEEMWYALTEDPNNIARFGPLQGIVHCAGYSSVNNSVVDPAIFYDNNVVKTIQMLECLKDLEEKPFIIFSSSASVYGSTVQYISAPYINEMVPCSPESPYAHTKLMVEQILKDYEVYGFKHTTLRYFNAAGLNVWDDTLGIREDDQHILPMLFKAHINKQPFWLHGTDYNTKDGSCVRDYIHVTDVADAIVRLCYEMRDFPVNETYNLGTGRGYSNREIIDAFVELVGPIALVEGDPRPGDTDTLVADPSKFINGFMMRPRFSDLETIINSMKRNYE